MRRHVVNAALLIVLSLLIPECARAALPYLDITSDVQRPDEEFVIKRVYSGNTPLIRWTATDDSVASKQADLDGWSFVLWYAADNSATSGWFVAQSSVASNQVVFSSITNFFAIPNDNYYVSIKGIHQSGWVRTWGVGRMNQKWDFATGNPYTNTQGILNTTQLNWSVFASYSGAWPFYAGSNITLTSSGTGLVISASATGGGTATNGINSVLTASGPTNGVALASNGITVTFATNGSASLPSVFTGNVRAASSAGLALLNSSGATTVLFGAGGGLSAMFSDGASFSGVVSGNGSGLTNLNAVSGAYSTSALLTLAVSGTNIVGGLSSSVATSGEWNAIGTLASNAVARSGDTMSGTLNAPKVRGTTTLFSDWRTTIGNYDGRIVHGAATVADGGQVGMSIIGDAGGTGEAIELGPFYSVGTIFGGGFIRMSGSDPVNLGRAMSFGFHPIFGTGGQQTTAIVKVYSSSDSALWARRYEGNASGLTNLAASELNAATSFVRGVGGEMTGVLTNFAGFVGNGAGLTNLAASGASANPFTNFYVNAVASPTNRFQFTVPTNELWSRIEINLTAYQTNDAAQGFIYFRINGATGTNVLHAYQTVNFSGATPSQTPGMGSASNDASGAYSARMWAPHNYSNAACRVSITLHDIYDPYPAKTYFANNWTKPRTGSGSSQQFIENNYGSVSIGGVVTGVEVLAIGTVFDTGTVLRVRGMP